MRYIFLRYIFQMFRKSNAEVCEFNIQLIMGYFENLYVVAQNQVFAVVNEQFFNGPCV